MSAPDYAPGDTVEIEHPQTGVRSKIVVERRFVDARRGAGFVGRPAGAPGVVAGGFDADVIAVARGKR
jgi:hypothetical protein